MPPRYQAERIATPRLTPQSPGSYPVDPFNRPPQDSNLGRLAEALGDLAPGLARLSSSFMASEKEGAEKKAYADFLDMQKTGKAIKAGEMDASGSPYYRRYYEETLGRLAASRYSSDMQTLMPTALAESTEAGDFDPFAAKFRTAWLTDNVGEASGDFLAGFNSAAAGYDINARTSHAEEAGARLKGRVMGTVYATHQQAIAELIPQGASPQQIADLIKIENQRQYFLNPKAGRQISQTTIAAVFDAARVFQDPNLLDILNYVDSAIPGATLGQTQEVLSKIVDVRNQINSDVKKQDAAAEASSKKKRQLVIDTQIDSLSDALDASEDPENVDVTPYVNALTGITGKDKAMERMHKLKEAYVRRDQQETAAQAGPLFQRAFRDTLTFEQVADAYIVGQISKDTAKELRGIIKANKSGRTKTIVSDERFTKAAARLDKMFQNTMGAYSSPVTQSLAQISMWQLERDWVRFMADPDPAMSPSIWLQQRSGELYIQNSGVQVSEGGHEQAAKIIQGFLDQQTPAQLSDWKKTRLVSPNFLSTIQKAHATKVANPAYQFPDAVKSFLQGYRIESKADLEAFLQAQSRLPEGPR